MQREEELEAKEDRLRKPSKRPERSVEERKSDPTFDLTREALDRYHDFDETFDTMLESVYESNAADSQRIVDEWFDKQKRLRLEVGLEFVKVTPNNIDKAPLVGIEFPERISGYIRAERKAK